VWFIKFGSDRSLFITIQKAKEPLYKNPVTSHHQSLSLMDNNEKSKSYSCDDNNRIIIQSNRNDLRQDCEIFHEKKFHNRQGLTFVDLIRRKDVILKRNNNSKLYYFPDSLYMQIFEMLTPQELSRLMQVSKRFNHICGTNSIWNNLLKRELKMSWKELCKVDKKSVMSAKKMYMKICGSGSFFSEMKWEKISYELIGIESNELPHQFFSSCIHDKTTIIIFGGYMNSQEDNLGNRVYLIDSSTSPCRIFKPEIKGDPPSKRAGHCSILIGRNMFVFGGDRSEKSVHILNIDTWTWDHPNVSGNPPGLSISKFLHSCHHIDGTSKVIVTGIWTGSLTESGWLDIRIFDTEKMAWEKCNVFGGKGFCDGQDGSFFYGGKAHFIDPVNQTVSILQPKEDSENSKNWTWCKYKIKFSKMHENSSHNYNHQNIISNCLVGNKAIVWQGTINSKNAKVYDITNQTWINLNISGGMLPSMKNGHSLVSSGTSVIVLGKGEIADEGFKIWKLVPIRI
jgi:hypothetical protein